jgi:hypothetical protein
MKPDLSQLILNEIFVSRINYHTRAMRGQTSYILQLGISLELSSFLYTSSVKSSYDNYNVCTPHFILSRVLETIGGVWFG